MEGDSSYSGHVIMPTTEELRDAIPRRTQKLLAALSTALGLTAWSILSVLTHRINSSLINLNHEPSTMDEEKVHRQGLVSIVQCVTTVQCHLMQLSGKPSS